MRRAHKTSIMNCHFIQIKMTYGQIVLREVSSTSYFLTGIQTKKEKVPLQAKTRLDRTKFLFRV